MDEKLLQSILKQHKDTVAKTADDIKLKNLKPISTGSLSLDIALGLPLPYGITEFAGAKGVGKTTIALESTCNAQKLGFEAHYFNMERSVNERSFDGIALDRKALTVWYPSSAEETLDIIESIVRAGKNKFIVIDSVAAMVSEKALTESASKEFMALIARLLSAWLPKAQMLLEKQESVLLLVNQLRENLNPYAGPYRTPGGNSKDFYTQEQVFFRTNKSSRLTGAEEDDFKGHIVTAEVTKNRFAPPFRKAQFPIVYLPGPHIDRAREVAQLAVDFALVQKGGSWITLPDGETKIQGLEALVTLLREDTKLYESLTASITGMVQ